MKAIAGMSGGVDSSISAFLLTKRGFDVHGISILMFESRKPSSTSCCSLESVKSASDTARHLGIGHSVVDARDEFIEKVIEPFAQAYSNGLTPNPCILCNKHVKFPTLMREAEAREADFISTGHYADIEIKDGHALLKKGIDPRKDQSYYLYVLAQDTLKKTIFPLGGMLKKDVRNTALAEGLTSAAHMPESQEICFVQECGYGELITSLHPSLKQSGPIKDSSGKIIGTHKGIYRYTVGQRKGLGISSKDPLYVMRIDAKENTIYAAHKHHLLANRFIVKDVNYIMDVGDIFHADVKIRSTMKPMPVTVRKTSSGALEAHLKEPYAMPSPGQAAVFYIGEYVICGGTITD